VATPIPTSLASRLLAPYREGIGALDRTGWFVVTGTFLFVASRLSLVTFLGIHLVEERGFGIALVGLAFLLENVGRGAVSPFGGALSDRYGRPPVLFASIALGVLLVPLILLVDTPAQLLAWSVLSGLAAGPVFPTVTALLSDLTVPERRQTVLAVNYTALSLGYTAGVAPAGFLAARGFGALVAFSVGLLLLVGLLLAVGLRTVGEPPAPSTTSEARSVMGNALLAARDPVFLAFAALGFVFPLGIGLVAFTVPVYAVSVGVGEATLGLVLAAIGLLLAVLSIPVNARVGPLGPFRLLALSALLAGLSYPLLAHWPTAAGIFAGLAVFTVAEVLFSAAIPTAVSMLAPPGSRGAYQGSWALVHAGASGVALALAGVLEARVGWVGTWWAFGAFTLVAAGGLLAARGWLRRAAAARTPG
jgi:MFS family permease